MNAEQWRQVDRIFHDAIDRAPGERMRFLDEVCAGNFSLRKEVQALIISHEGTGSFLESPAAPPILSLSATIEAGTRFGPYEVRSPLGAGGMGEVYRARDTTLNRDVALKVLPELFAADADRLARFKREALMLASLNHPNIGAIYGLAEAEGRLALVLELIEGPTLADRIAKGPILFEQALPIARQIAEALEAAHEKGIIHRDLKPANIKITPEGLVKVLDFGLAKARDAEAQLSSVPTMNSVSTPGMILGTPAYMSPEQATGKEADRRSDVWAFGCVFYEMLGQHRAFAGETANEILAGVLKDEPDWQRLPHETPESIRRLLRRCLQKDRKERLQHVGDARIEIAEAQTGTTVDDPPVQAPSRRKERLAWISAVGLIVVAATLWTFRPIQPPAAGRTVRFTIPIPGGSGPEVVFALSPSGRYVAITAVEDGKRRLWVRPIDTLEAGMLPGTDGATGPFWSPNESEIGFVADGKLKKISIAGGLPAALADSTAKGPSASWSRGVIVFATNRDLYRVDEAGGVASPVVVHKSNEDLSNPQFLPGGERFLFVQIYGDKPGIYVGSLNGTLPVRILDDLSSAIYAPPAREGAQGYLLVRRSGSLTAQPFDPATLTLSGTAKPVAESVINLPTYGPSVLFSSSTGALAYQPESTSQLFWVDRSGAPKQLMGPPGEYGDFRISPDETKIAMDINRTGNVAENREIATFDVKQGILERLTSHPLVDVIPIWSPDGLRIAFTSNRLGAFDPYVTSAPNQEKLLADMEPLGGWPTDWSRDGRFILWQGATAGPADLWIIPVSGSPKPYTYLNSRFAETDGVFSPDGRWIAYTSDESGHNEVYVRSFPDTGRGNPVSGTGGSGPSWRNDGRELFYVAGDSKLTAVRVTLGDTSIELSQPQSLFTAPVGTFRRNYEVSKDGQRFLISRPAQAGGTAITVVLNWQALLER